MCVHGRDDVVTKKQRGNENEMTLTPVLLGDVAPLHMHLHLRQDEGTPAHGPVPHRTQGTLLESC